MAGNKIPCTDEFRALEKAKRKSDLAWTKVDLAQSAVSTVGVGAALKCAQSIKNPASFEACVAAGLGFATGLAGFLSLLEDANDADLDAADAANKMLDCVNDHKEFFGDLFDGVKNF